VAATVPALWLARAHESAKCPYGVKGEMVLAVTVGTPEISAGSSEILPSKSSSALTIEKFHLEGGGRLSSVFERGGAVCLPGPVRMQEERAVSRIVLLNFHSCVTLVTSDCQGGITCTS